MTSPVAVDAALATVTALPTLDTDTEQPTESEEEMFPVAVVLVHDPTTGIATKLVAAASWTPTEVLRWMWMPGDDHANQLRYGVIATLDPAEQAAWLTHYRDDPSITHFIVHELTQTSRTEAAAVTNQALIDVIKELY